MKWFALFSLLISPLFSEALLDLEETLSPFVLETKRISIPNHPFAFNPSIIRWNGRLLMSFRVIPGNKKSFNSEIGLIWLDEELNSVGQPQLLALRDPKSTVPCRAEDGRLVQVGNRLYLIYSDCTEEKVSKKGFRVHLAELIYDKGLFRAVYREALTQFEGESENHREKNWVPFDDSGRLNLAYSIEPHLIFRPVLQTGSCETIASTTSSIDWKWGRVCGGTPALLIDGQYLSIFHSWINMESVQSKGAASSHYFMGAYTFSPYPPFQLTSISPAPIVAKGFYSGEEYPYYWKPVQALFPCGIIADHQFIWVAYGRQDHETWVVKFDKQGLLNSLIPVFPKQ